MGDPRFWKASGMVGVNWDQDSSLKDMHSECAEERLELINDQQTTMEDLKITKEKVREAAAKCSTAAATLKTLFPEVFEKKDEPLKIASSLAGIAHGVYVGTGTDGYRSGTYLFASSETEVRVAPHPRGMGRTIITFHKKK